ncbi:MAG: response regulator transcription factor [Ferruginibacter sp.]
MINFLVIDDHQIVRAGIKNMLLELYDPCTVDDAEDETAARILLDKNNYHLVILDIHMENTDSLGLTQYIVSRFPLSPILIFSMNPEALYAKRFISAGASGFVSKNAETEELKNAISLCMNKRRYLSEGLTELMVGEIGDKNAGHPFGKLSTRELEIANLIIKAETNTSISLLLSLGMSTIGTYKMRIFKKLGVKNVLELSELKKVYD